MKLKTIQDVPIIVRKNKSRVQTLNTNVIYYQLIFDYSLKKYDYKDHLSTNLAD